MCHLLLFSFATPNTSTIITNPNTHGNIIRNRSPPIHRYIYEKILRTQTPPKICFIIENRYPPKHRDYTRGRQTQATRSATPPHTATIQAEGNPTPKRYKDGRMCFFMSKQITCKSCGRTFTLNAKQIKFYDERGWSTPCHCSLCREEKRRERSSRYYGLYEAMFNYTPCKKRRQRVHYALHLVGGFR